MPFLLSRKYSKPTEYFKNPQIVICELLHKISQSTDFEPLKCVNVRSDVVAAAEASCVEQLHRLWFSPSCYPSSSSFSTDVDGSFLRLSCLRSQRVRASAAKASCLLTTHCSKWQPVSQLAGSK